jgi:hypothetical protein
MGSRRHPDRDIDADFDEHAVKVVGPAHEAAGWRKKSNTPVSKAIVIRLEHWGHSPRKRGAHPPKGRGTRWEG